MTIDRALNIVLEMARADGSRLFIHATPLSAEIFDRYWEPISETVAAIFKGEHGIVTGPRIAHKMLRKQAEKLGVWSTQDGVERGLMPEIRRLTNLLLVGDNGWQQVPFEHARRKEMVSAREADEVEGRLVFFTCASCVILQEDQGMLLERAAELWHARLESSTCMDLLTSLQTLTAAESSGETTGA